ncbi:hypothetical protein H9X85_03935 [Anaerotignum lactatifermentans]|uniref:Zinc-ribbon domain-containing protein n=1 Tax=Anaerotignum lactatifermentans TaxID=160404 RepID=A0ABS2G920_9FIRM|nr:hypothetical protein [Anaerotignum lactatifermentans]MBM6828780.1 hypothetical protein [Anaerotignum lactatifermentans]MBM6877107.1 hypothetical protein [Anaerotignum lactatifermentans]MBM6950362.1 hypothetical protein [Anaerotignum lactatifermentans]
MSYCPKCGREIIDESLGCPICSVRDNVQYGSQQQEQSNPAQSEEPKAEKVESFTVEDGNGTYQRFESRQTTGGTWGENPQNNRQYDPVHEPTIHPALKVIVIVLIILVGGIGAVAGLIAGIILMKSPAQDYQRFGKTITIVSAIMLALSLICCVASGFVGMAALPFTYYY